MSDLSMKYRGLGLIDHGRSLAIGPRPWPRARPRYGPVARPGPGGTPIGGPGAVGGSTANSLVCTKLAAWLV